MKITIVGGGNVGSTTALRLASRELAREIVVLDVVDGLAEGRALDLNQAAPLVRSDTRIVGATDYARTEGSDVVVVTAGLSRRPGMTHDDLLVRNADIVRNVVRSLVERSPGCIILIVSSPLDEMTYVALRASGFPRSRVIGMSGVLDGARLRSFLAEETRVAMEDIEVMVIGGHGQNMVPLLRHATIGGLPLAQLVPRDRRDAIVERTRRAGTEIIEHLRTGSAFHAPSAAVTAMVEAIALDKGRVMPCSVLLDGEYGMKDLVIGVPIVLGREGVRSILEVRLNGDEEEAFGRSARAVRDNIAKLTFQPNNT